MWHSSETSSDVAQVNHNTADVHMENVHILSICSLTNTTNETHATHGPQNDFQIKFI